jgi:hypothetical protein
MSGALTHKGRIAGQLISLNHFVAFVGKYELAAVLTHKGRSADSGHYVAWCKQADGKWVLFDDDELTPKACALRHACSMAPIRALVYLLRGDVVALSNVVLCSDVDFTLRPKPLVASSRACTSASVPSQCRQTYGQRVPPS